MAGARGTRGAHTPLRREHGSNVGLRVPIGDSRLDARRRSDTCPWVGRQIADHPEMRLPDRAADHVQGPDR